MWYYNHRYGSLVNLIMDTKDQARVDGLRKNLYEAKI